MVQIKVKAINHSYTVFCAYDDFQVFLTMLKERLNACAKSHNGKFEAFFHILNDVSEQELKDIIQSANEAHTVVLGLCHEEKKRDLMIVEQDLHSGQTYHFDEEILLLGSINADAFVTSSESMYCIGAVNGNVDLLHEDCTISASSFFQANIRICDARYQNVTSFSPAQVYYKERVVQIKEFKEERAWAVQ